ncbi:MAG: hypothetical protein KF745_00850 [Phycisphaeraceae bacterium]|nr:hypothetical protein [Phycisphaeraceae bacterium]
MRSERKGHRGWAGVFGLALLASVAVLAGCPAKKAPPPPPPPPAPPPAPPPLTLGTLAQDMQADPRVQFADNVEVFDEAFARSVVSLADAIARGSASGLRSMVTPSTSGVLSMLETSGDWSAETGKLEAVRIVYIGAPPSSDLGLPPPGSLPEVSQAEMMKLAEKMQGAMASLNLTQEDMMRIAAAGPNAPQVIEEMKGEGKFTDEQMQKFQDAVSEALPAAMTGGRSDFVPERAVVLAMQDPAGAYLLGWFSKSSGDDFVWTGAPSASLTRPRASDFDSIGLAAFSSEQAAAWKPTERSVGSGDEASTDPAAGVPVPTDEAPKGPRKKSTPAGPVTIPGG